MFAAFAISWISPKIYRATTYVLISESGVNPAAPSPGWEYSILPTYLRFADNDVISMRAIKHFHLYQPPYRLTPHQFRREFMDVQIPKNTSLLQIQVDFPDARLAAGLANYVAKSATELNAQVSAAQTLSTQSFLKARLDRASSHLREAESKSLEISRRARIEDRERKLTILLDQKEQIAKELEQLRLALAQQRERAKSLEESVKAEPAILLLKKSVLSDRFLDRMVQKLAPDNRNFLSATEEAVNPTRQGLERELADSRASLAADHAGLDLAKITLSQINEDIIRLLAQVTDFRSQISDADQDLKLAREGYESAARDYRNASVTVTAKSEDLKQIAPALIPDRPVRPRIILNTFVAGFLGLIVLGGIALSIESFRPVQQETFHIMEQETASARHT